MPASKPTRVKPDATVTVAGTRIRNKTATSIEVALGEDGEILVTNCCLEEQGA